MTDASSAIDSPAHAPDDILDWIDDLVTRNFRAEGFIGPRRARTPNQVTLGPAHHTGVTTAGGT